MSRSTVDAIFRERRLAAMRAEVEASHNVHPRNAHPRRGFDPNQPRVPKGHSDGGQWRKAREDARVRVATGPFIWRELLRELIRELAWEAIEDYRKNYVDDLAGETNDTVALTILDGKEVWGDNSWSRAYSQEDKFRAARLREDLIKKYPSVMKTKNTGQKPNDAVFHAETTLLLRAAKENGGTLTGRTLEVYVDGTICPTSCPKVLPLVGLELGNPTVLFIERSSHRILMIKDGRSYWVL